MTINSLSTIASTVIGGLGTQTYNVVNAGLYTCAFQIFIPYVPAGSSNNSSVTTGGSSCLVVVNQNGSPVLTMALPSINQPLIGGSVRIQAAANDVITVVLSSAALADNLPNAIKGIINVYQGE
jgi:hypothetical protein